MIVRHGGTRLAATLVALALCSAVMSGPAQAARPSGGGGGGGGGGGTTKPVKVGTPNGTFSCRAALARLEGAGLLDGVFLEVNAANPQQDPCQTDFAGILAELNLSKNLLHKKGVLGSTLLNVELKVLYGGTELLKDFKTSPALPRKAVAEAGVAVLSIQVLGNFVEVAVLTSNAKAKCSSTNVPLLSGQSQVVGLRINHIDIDLLSGHRHITLQVSALLRLDLIATLGHLLTVAEIDALINIGLGLHFNEQTITSAANGAQLTQQALWLESNLIGDLVIAEAIADYHGNPCTTTTGPPPPPPPPNPSNDWMTGGGRINDTAAGKVTHGFRLECTPANGQNNLQVNWEGESFHLLTASTATCDNGPDGINSSGNPTAGFDTFKGTGTGRCRGGGTATAAYTLVDKGEPGEADTFTVKITGDCNLTATGTLQRGNHQAHGRF